MGVYAWMSVRVCVKNTLSLFASHFAQQQQRHRYSGCCDTLYIVIEYIYIYKCLILFIRCLCSYPW